MKRASRDQIAAAAKIEIQEYVSRLPSADVKEALTAFFEKRRPDFSRTNTAPQAVNQ
jgi:enoyl-CoA hydratase/carnithine racemase